MTNFRRNVCRYVEVKGDVCAEVSRFLSYDYKIVELKGNGLIGYTEHEEYYFIWFVYIDNKLSNAKEVYKLAKELSKIKPVLYTGVKDYYCNNSIHIEDDVYQINYKRK